MQTWVNFFHFACISFPIWNVPPNLLQNTCCMTDEINQQSSWFRVMGQDSWELHKPTLTWSKWYLGQISLTTCSIKPTCISSTGDCNPNSASFLHFPPKVYLMQCETSTYGEDEYHLWWSSESEYVNRMYPIWSLACHGAWDKQSLSFYVKVQMEI